MCDVGDNSPTSFLIIWGPVTFCYCKFIFIFVCCGVQVSDNETTLTRYKDGLRLAKEKILQLQKERVGAVQCQRDECVGEGGCRRRGGCVGGRLQKERRVCGERGCRWRGGGGGRLQKERRVCGEGGSRWRGGGGERLIFYEFGNPFCVRTPSLVS